MVTEYLLELLIGGVEVAILQLLMDVVVQLLTSSPPFLAVLQHGAQFVMFLDVFCVRGRGDQGLKVVSEQHEALDAQDLEAFDQFLDGWFVVTFISHHLTTLIKKFPHFLQPGQQRV